METFYNLLSLSKLYMQDFWVLSTENGLKLFFLENAVEQIEKHFKTSKSQIIKSEYEFLTHQTLNQPEHQTWLLFYTDKNKCLRIMTK